MNYRIGDLGSMSREPCPCGRTLPMLSALEGRVEDVIFLANGDFVHPHRVLRGHKELGRVLRYQLIQHEAGRFEIKLQTVDRATYDRVVTGIVEDLRGLLGASVIIEAAYHEELRPSGSGKFRPVLSYYKPEHFV